ncbi:MAG: hypothetical protein GY759_07250 [Chloroflexi bacterium]|nr:hypothetical protein [Chloroflexota bacterium]
MAAFQVLAPNIGAGTQQLLSSTPLPLPPVFLIGLLNDLAALPHPLILVLDDYHESTESSPLTAKNAEVTEENIGFHGEKRV